MKTYRAVLYIVTAIFIISTVYYYGLDGTTMISPPRSRFKEMSNWILQGLNVSRNSTISYIKTNGIETYLLSAVVRYRTDQTFQIIFNSLDFTKGRGDFLCCLISDGSLMTTPAKFHYIYRHLKFIPSISQTFFPAAYDATQYSCEVSKTVLRNPVTKATLTLTSSCSHKKEDYHTVVYPKRVSNGLAICAKIVCDVEIEPTRLIELFEIQKLLGVDKIVLYDYKCPPSIQTILQHYVAEGILDLVPYSLPGNPERGYASDNRVYPQFYHDEEITVMDCHERLFEYQYVLVSTIDDILLPRQHFTVKDLLKNLTESHQQAGGFYFQVQYHVEDWGKHAEVSGSYFQQYVKSTKPTPRFLKYIYLPRKSSGPPDDSFKNILPFHEQYIEPSLATIHHYGKCPGGWKDCVPETIADKTMTKYQKMVLNNTRTVLDKLQVTKF